MTAIYGATVKDFFESLYITLVDGDDELPIDNDFEFPVRSVLLGPRTQLYTAQDYLAIHKVRHYLKKSGNFPLPEITVVKGKRWIWNGHHRIIASRLAGTPLYVYSYKVD